MPKTVLITGANRGLGRGLTQLYLELPDHIIIAAVRNPQDPTSISLQTLPKAPTTTLMTVKLDVTVEDDASTAVKTLKDEHGVQKLDLVIANAGISYIWPKLSDVKIGDMKAHIEANVYGVVRLWQATRDLLLKSESGPTFVLMGSQAGVLS